MDHLLVIANSASLGGASLSLLEILRRLPAVGYRATVAIPETGPFALAAERLGVDVCQCPHPPWVTPGTTDAWLYALRQLPDAVARFRALIAETRPDVVWTNTATTPAGACAALLERIPHIWCVGEFLGQGGLAGPLSPETLYRCIQGMSTGVIAISTGLKALFPRPEQVDCITAPVDISPFLDVEPDYACQTITSIGTISESKGLGDLADAAILLNRRGLDFRVVVIGDFYYVDYLAAIEQRLQQAGARDRLTFVPYQKDVARWLAQSSIYCCPSHTEGMSRTIIEAMAAGLPVVATDCGGPRDLVRDQETGSLVPVRDPQALAVALEYLLTDSAKRQSQGISGRAAAQAFDAETVVPRLIERIEAARHAPALSAETGAFVTLFLSVLQEAGPRVLLGKKWRLLRRFL